VRVEVPVLPDDSVTVAGFRDAVGPVGETVEERLTVPVNPPMLISEIVDVADEPGGTLIDGGLAEMLKSGVGGVDWWNRQPVTGWISQPLKLCHCWLS